ncbi:MAG: helix-turn-helix domain-containing protein [Spirochaetes bacterium]|nr:helix-turn-helix domain-containing protein [Spirochaetota bacterium]
MRRVKITEALAQEGGDPKSFPEFPLQTTRKHLVRGVSAHLHDAFEVEILLRGRARNVYSGSEYALEGGDLFLGNHMESHALRFKGPVSFLSLKFRPAVLLADGEANAHLLDPFVRGSSAFRGRIPATERERKTARALLDQIHRERGAREGDWRGVCRSLFLAFLKILHRIWLREQGDGPGPKHHPLPYRLMAWIDGHFQEDLRIEDLARRFEMSPSRLGALFRGVFGQSPKAYLFSRRLAHARELLASGAVGVTEAALHSGWSDVSVFHKAFKKATGIAPSRYRESRPADARDLP